MTRMDPRTFHPQTYVAVRSARVHRRPKHADTVLATTAMWAGLLVMGCRHLASRFGAFTRHRFSELGRTTGTQGGSSGGTQGLSWITYVVKAIFRSQSTRSPSLTESPIVTARLAGMVGACLIVGFAGVTAVRSGHDTCPWNKNHGCDFLAHPWQFPKCGSVLRSASVVAHAIKDGQ